jgi:hypothetical protein
MYFPSALTLTAETACGDITLPCARTSGTRLAPTDGPMLILSTIKSPLTATIGCVATRRLTRIANVGCMVMLKSQVEFRSTGEWRARRGRGKEPGYRRKD